MRPLNIALFTDTFIPQVNGVANTVYRSAISLSKLGHNVCICTISKKSEEDLAKLIDSKIKVITLPSINSFVYKGERLSIPLGFSLKKLRKFQPDIIHTNTPFSIGWEAIISARKLKVPLVGTHHTFFDHYLKYIFLDYAWARNLSWKYVVGYYNYCDLITSPTKSLLEGLKDNGLKKEIIIVQNPVDTEKFCPATNKNNKEKSLIYMGRVSYEKSIDQVIKSLVFTKKQFPNIKLIIIGDGPEKAKLITLVNELNLENNVVFKGFLYGKDLIEQLQNGSIFLLGSKSENMPLAVLEAMAIGLPIIAVSSLGMIEIVKDNENGFLLSPDNPEEMSLRTVELLRNNEMLKNFSKKSREMSLQYSDMEAAKKIIEEYRKLIDKKI